MSETKKIMSVADRLLILPLWRRAWICATGFRAWRTRRALDKAICLMIRNDMEIETAYQLLEVSNRLWNADLD